MEILFAAVTVIASVVGVGVALGTMIRGLRSDIERRIDGLERRMDELEARVRALEATLNRVVGLLEGLGLTGQLPAERKPVA